MSRISSIVVALAITTGCAADPDHGDEPEINSVESAITITPSAGQWVYGEIAPISTNCSVSGLLSQLTILITAPFMLDTVTTSGFRVVPGDGTGAFSCTYDEGRFSCPNRARATVDLRPFVDLAVTVQVTATGIFTDSRHARGKQGAGVSCVGSYCSLLGDLPCGFVDNFEAYMP